VVATSPARAVAASSALREWMCSMFPSWTSPPIRRVVVVLLGREARQR
jgi:hypothetical protein